MRVLLLGATGNLGSRLVPALLAHDHTVIAYVRNPAKLHSLLPAQLYDRITVVTGNAADSAAVAAAIESNAADAVINTAGVAALAPWGKSDLPEIFNAVVEAARKGGERRGAPLRVWILGGQGVLFYPGTERMLSDFFPIFLEHSRNLRLLRSMPERALEWSMLCPNWMAAGSKDLSSPSEDLSPPLQGGSMMALVAKADEPPHWSDSWVRHIPLIGKTLVAAANAGRYKTTLEQNAEFIAADLAGGESLWIGKAVGVISKKKAG